MKTIGVFADKPMASTGMAVVCNNIATQLSNLGARVIYFGRFGLEGSERGYDQQPVKFQNYTYVKTEGGVWNETTVRTLIKAFNVDVAFCEDDWYSSQGIISACLQSRVPFHFLTPIDSLPIHKKAFKLFPKCTRVYTPNSSYKQIENGIFLPHGVDGKIFTPLRSNQKRLFPQFTFLWIGRNEVRKAMGRAILAYKKVQAKFDDIQMVIRSDWTTKNGVKTAMYLMNHPELKIIKDQMKDVPHAFMQNVYANCDVSVITSKAGGFELQSIEAQACGVIPLVTDWDFMRETVVDEKGGFLIDIENTEYDPIGYQRIWGNISVDELADKMIWCANNRKRVKIMGNWARQHVIESFNWEDIAQTLYNEMDL